MSNSARVLFLLSALFMFFNRCKTTTVTTPVVSKEYELKGFEKFARVLDRETGILIYVSEIGVSCIRIQAPTVSFDKLSDRDFPDFGHKFSRVIDREYSVIIYSYCAAMDYRTCDSAAVKFSAK